MQLGSLLPTRCALALFFLQTAMFTTLLPSCPPECICLSQSQFHPFEGCDPTLSRSNIVTLHMRKGVHWERKPYFRIKRVPIPARETKIQSNISVNRFNDDLAIIIEWGDINLVEFNAGKTQVLCNSGGLREIPKKLLPSTVEHLSFTRNHFPVIKSDSFAGLRYLRKLSLDGNNISVIKPFAFRGMPRLRELSIQQTPLATVAQFAFAGLQNISAIYLSHNKIKQVESYAFAGTSNLKLLVLANNPIHKLDSHAFSGLNGVERLTFPSGIRLIEPDAFDGLDTIGYIKLAFMDLRGLSTGIFRGLTNVGVLSIQESDLGIIDGSAFNGMTFIKTLNILNNKIDAIEYMNITQEQRIGHLKFQGNHILEIPKTEVLLIEVEKLTVISNHFPCNCHIHSLLEGPLVNGSVTEFIMKNFCISPLEVNGLPMNTLDIDAIGRCEEEVTRGNLEASNDSINRSHRFTDGLLSCVYLAIVVVIAR